MKRVAITGGIGSGKSTVCRALSAIGGAPIYDSDLRAKELMNSDAQIRRQLTDIFGPEAYTAEGLNRPYIASRAFSNPALLQHLNSVVHPRVVEDFEEWAESHKGDYVILESALLFTSPLVGHYDLAVVVDAPIEMRIERTVARDGVTAEQVRGRIANQMPAEQMRARADVVIEADGRDLTDLLVNLNQKIRNL
jgi:dephospho-CoA kinase